MTPALWLLVLTGVAGLYMAWNIGANDVANAMGTSVGSGALTLRQALLVAAIFEFGGAVLVGGHVTDTIRSGIIETARFEPTGALGAEGPLLLALGMFSALLASGIWLQIATMAGLPVSTTHAIVGAVAGFGIVALGVDAVAWSQLIAIVLSWVVSPLMGGAIAWAMFSFVRGSILKSDDPAAAVKRVGPYLVGLVAAILVLSFVYKALSNVVPDPPPLMTLGAALACGMLATFGMARFLASHNPAASSSYLYVERVFGWLQIATAVFVAFAHGANDVANAVGPLAAVVSIASSGLTTLSTEVPVPTWVLALGGVGIVVGLGTWGYKVIMTIGQQITEMTPSRGFSAEFGAATTVLLASRLGLPVSTTHTLVGAVVGVGFAQGMGALNLSVIGRIVKSWLATIPTAALLSMGIFWLLRTLFT